MAGLFISFVMKILQYYNPDFCGTVPRHLNFLGSLISGVSGLFTSGINAASSANTAKKNLQAQREANATNLQINRETNEANQRLAREQNEWNLQQWYRQNAYNTPSAQFGRFASAGINPYMAVGQVTGGNATSNLESANLANQVPTQVQPVQGVQPLDAAMSTFSNQGIPTIISMVQALSQFMKDKNEIEAGQIQNSWLDKRIRLDYMRGQKAFQKETADTGITEFKLRKLGEYYDDDRIMQSIKEAQHLSTDLLVHEVNKAGYAVETQQYQNAILKIVRDKSQKELDNYDRLFSAQLGQILASTAGINASVQQGWANIGIQRYRATTERMNAETNRMNATTQRMIAESGIKLNGSIMELNEEQRRYVATQIVEKQAQIQGIRLDNKSKEFYVSATTQLLPQRIKAEYLNLQTDINRYKARGKLYYQVLDATADMIIKQSQARDAIVPVDANFSFGIPGFGFGNIGTK